MIVFENIRKWARERNLIAGSTPDRQFLKLIEEIGELAEALGKNKMPDVIDAIGDSVVVLTIMAAQLGLDIETCIRGGRMITLEYIRHRCAIDTRTECWNWRQTTVNGYGRIHVGGRHYYAHRLAYEIVHGPLRHGLDVMHECENRLCCNPEHLVAGSRKQTMARARANGRISMGLRHAIITRRNARAKAKLTIEQVRQIRLRMDEDRRALAAEYGVSESCIRKIWAHRIWKDAAALVAPLCQQR